MAYVSARFILRGTLIAIPNAAIGEEKIGRISTKR
jgi:hypothetical protein